MKRIDSDIKNGQFRPIYLLFGVETYLIRQYRDKLLCALVQEGDTMNFSRFEGADIDPREIIDLAGTLPFFAERRVILIEGSGLFKKSSAELAEYLAAVPESTCILFVEQEVDRKTKMFKETGRVGLAVEFARQTDEILLRWIEGRLKKNGKTMTRDAYAQFIRKTGNDMENIDRELEKLLCYTLERECVEAEDVAAITTEKTENKIFDMVDAVAAHQQKKALELYYDLLSLKEPPMRIMYLISAHFQQLIVVKSMTNHGFGSRDIASKAGCPDWAVRKYQSQSRLFSMELLKAAIEDGASFEEAAKSGKMQEQLAVELFLLKYSV